MIETVKYECSPMAIELTGEIDKEIICKILAIQGVSQKEINEFCFTHDKKDSTDSVINSIASYTTYKILSVDPIYSDFSTAYIITIDNSIEVPFEENRSAVELEFIANSV